MAVWACAPCTQFGESDDDEDDEDDDDEDDYNDPEVMVMTSTQL